MRLQKWLSGLLAGVMLLGLAACGGETVSVSVEESALTAQEAIEKGDYETAYKLLQGDTSAEAQALLNKLIFVPVNYDWKSKSQEGHWQFTYDEKGNPLSKKETENGKTYETIYQYDAQGKLVSSTHTNQGEVTETATYTCDEKGRVIREQIYYESHTSTYTYTYDAEGNLISEIRVYGDGDAITDTYESGKYYDAISNSKKRISATADTYTQDEFGNYVAWANKRTEMTCSWKLFYYPNGVPMFVWKNLEMVD